MNGMAPNTGAGIGSSAWNERMKLIRFRRKRENLRFWKEFKLIPGWVIGLVIFLFLVAQGIAVIINLDVFRQGVEMFPPELRGQPVLASFALAGLVTVGSLVVATIIFMAVYVNQDAKRRGMNSAVWTLICLLLAPGYLVLGFVVYMLMREPLPYPCPKCGTTVGARFNFCPACKCNLHPSCPQCRQEIAETDRFCPYCACELAQQRDSGSVFRTEGGGGHIAEQ